MKARITGLLVLMGIISYGQQANQAVGGVTSWAGQDDNREGKQVNFTFNVKGNASDTWLVIENLYSDIRIEGTSGSEIKIESMNYRGLPEKAKGLKPLSATGPENTGVGLHMKQEGNIINLSGAHKEADRADYVMYLPKSLNLKIDYNGWQVGDVIIKGMAGEVEAKSQVGDLKFIDVTGPLVAHTLSSNVEVTFSSLSPNSPTSLSSTSGDIDITLPSNAKGLFKMSTISGGVYTGFDFDFGESEIKRIGGQSATGKLNGGGVEVTLKSVSGDIYVRKAE